MQRGIVRFAKGIVLLFLLLGLISYFFIERELEHRGPVGYCGPFEYNVSTEDQAVIADMITTIGSTSTVGLAFKQGSVKAQGRSINHVPPLQFLATIFRNPVLVGEMRKIKESSAKYNPFVEGLKKNLYFQHKIGCLSGQIEGFSKTIGLQPKQVEKVLNQCLNKCSEREKDPCFKPFVDFLIEQKSK